jgi:glycosyltransferase involved in cell wall biosynthesis
MHWFVVPQLDRPVTGGTLYNRGLIAALVARGEACRVAALPMALPVLQEAHRTDCIWIDSLYLTELPAIASALGEHPHVGLIVHYLPSLVARAGSIDVPTPSPEERAALHQARMFLVPSDFMATTVAGLLEKPRPILRVVPGCEISPCGRQDRSTAKLSPPRRPGVRALAVANLVPGKRVAALVDALATRLSIDDHFELTVLGDATLDPGYAQSCADLARHPSLRDRVRLLGSVAPPAVEEQLRRSNLFVSASAMESYGMALAEARTAGVPILATAGGNTGALVEPRSGGEVLDTPDRLADACVALVRSPIEHRRRLTLARAHALPPRSWSIAASDFVAQMKRANQMETRVRDRDDLPLDTRTAHAH